MAVKYYAVAVGKKPGIYTKWDECKAMVHGFPGAVYKSFKTLEEAETFLESAPARGGEAHAKGAAQQKATQGAAQQKSWNSRRRQGRDERRNLPERQRICRRITRSWMALFTPVPACTVMEVF